MDALLGVWRSIPVLARPFLFIPLIVVAHALFTPSPEVKFADEASVAAPAQRPTVESRTHKFTEADVREAIEKNAAFNEPFVVSCNRRDPDDQVCRDLQRRGLVDVVFVTDRAVRQLHDIRWEPTARARGEMYHQLRETPDTIGIAVAKRVIASIADIYPGAKERATARFEWTWVALNEAGRASMPSDGGTGSVYFRESGGKWSAYDVAISGVKR